MEPRAAGHADRPGAAEPRRDRRAAGWPVDQENRAPAFAEAIYRETEGNPFFVEEVVKAVLAQEQLYAADDQQRKGITELAISQSIKEAIGRRLRRLSHECGEMLHTAAALGKTFAFDDLAAVVPSHRR